MSKIDVYHMPFASSWGHEASASTLSTWPRAGAFCQPFEARGSNDMLTKETAHRKDMTAPLATMEHRHFATIAAIIRDMPDGPFEPAEIAQLFADRLEDTNPRFDRYRFILACVAEG